MYKLIILPYAKQHIRTAALWYNEQEKGLGKKFTKQVRNKIAFIKQNPNAVAIRYKKIRTAIVDVFPFMIHFTVKEEQKQIIISDVYHTSFLNPKSWNKRT